MGRRSVTQKAGLEATQRKRENRRARLGKSMLRLLLAGDTQQVVRFTLGWGAYVRMRETRTVRLGQRPLRFA